ncbi:hypothetical protein IJ843_07025 [bacterium]|nr:hypothetical protein [bacterium]
MNCLNKLFITFISILYLCLPTFAAFDIDTSVDSEIRKKYNPKKIEQDLLPPLPDNLKNDIPLKSNENFSKSAVKPSSSNTSNQTMPLKEVKTFNAKGQNITLKKGTKFTVRLTSGISDRLTAGTKIYFRLSKPIKTRYFSLSENTRFVGVITDSHTPQMSGNGGLIVIKVDRVTVNGKSQEINAKVTKANSKKIFFNNIKGKHTYWKGVANSIKPGKRFYDKMWATTKKLANDNVTVIFSPFTLITGVVVIGVNVIGSPLFAMFTKGGSISIPADSPFELKLLEDVTIYN